MRKRPHRLNPLAIISMSIGVGASALAQTSVARAIDIPPQPLAIALRQLADQTGLQVAFETSLTAGRQSPAVKGELSTQEALDKLLMGSGLRYEFLDDRTVAVAPASKGEQLKRISYVSTGPMRVAQVAPAVPAAAERVEDRSESRESAEASTEIAPTNISEVVVTGSRIARSAGVAPASPVEVLDAARLEATSSNSMATFLKDLPSNVGSSFSSGRGLGTSEWGAGTINLRGLGPAATLVLVDGQRTTQVPNTQDNLVDLNSLLPQNMIERIEVVKDGASAIYGSDAVAGVINFITKSSFNGMQIDGRFNRFTYSDKGDRTVEMLAGGTLGDGRGNFLLAASGFDQDSMILGSDLEILEGEAYDARWAGGANFPGVFTVTNRNAAGALTNTRRTFADPLCGQIEGAFPSSGRLINGVLERLPSAAGATACPFHYYPEGSAQSAIRQFKTYAKLNYDLSDDVTFNAATAYTTSKVKAYYTSGGLATLPNLIFPGHNPGNTFRAVDAQGRPLYAVSSGVSAGFSRDGAEVFLPTRDTAGNVVLTADPTNPASGIPFNEDAIYTGRGIGSQGGLPTGNSWRQPGYSQSRPSRSDLDLLRASAGLTGRLGSDWKWDVNVSDTQYTLSTNGQVGDSLGTQLRNSLQGLGGPNCTGTIPGRNGCEYYNIAGNSVFATTPGDPQANSQAVLDYVYPLQVDYYRSSLLVAEGQVSGKLAELPAGEVGLAFGYQMREASLKVDYDLNKNIRNTGSNTISFDFDESRTINAVFAEAIVPLFDSPLGYLEFSGAVRHEEASNFETTDPKLGFLYHTAGNWLTLRGTYGTSFVAPSLFRLFAVSSGGGAVNDVCASPVCTGRLNHVITSQTQGNPDLKPEDAETYNIGTTVRLMPNLSLSLDWWRYDFRNRIATEQAQQVLDMDPDGSRTGRVIRGATGDILQINTQYFNASSVVTSGLDIAMRYNMELGGLGRLNANLSASYVPTYKWQLVPGGAFENYAGEENQRRAGAAAATPKWRGNIFLGWNMNNHSVSSTVHYTDGLLFNKNGRISATLNRNYEVDSFISVDLSYTYRLGERFLPSALEEASLSFGAVNLFDSAIPELPVPANQKFVATLYDLRGRMLWAGVKVKL